MSEFKRFSMKKTFLLYPDSCLAPDLAAFAFVGGFEIVIFDCGFAQYNVGRCTVFA
jgi:hypothetical protein